MLSVFIIDNPKLVRDVLKDLFLEKTLLEALQPALLNLLNSFLVSLELMHVLLQIVHVEVAAVDLYWPRWVVCEVLFAA